MHSLVATADFFSSFGSVRAMPGKIDKNRKHFPPFKRRRSGVDSPQKGLPFFRIRIRFAASDIPRL